MRGGGGAVPGLLPGAVLGAFHRDGKGCALRVTNPQSWEQ